MAASVSSIVSLRSFLTLLVLTSCLAVPTAYGQFGLVAGGGWVLPRGDSALYIRNGWTGELALEVELGDNLSLNVGGARTTFSANAARLKADRGLPASDPLSAKTALIDLTLAPKFYLAKHDFAAFFTAGGGPRWITYINTASGSGIETTYREKAWGAIGGFGVDMAVSEGLNVGFAPTYHRVWADRKTHEYVTLVVFIRI